MKKELALVGGQPIRSQPHAPYNTIGSDEINSALEVLNSGVLSGYIAAPGEYFLGGEWTKSLEKAFCSKFNKKFAVSVNSATSGLHAALAAAGVKEGDEVIVSPYTMSASATSAVMCGAKPIFVDIEEDFFCLNPELVKEAITPKTKAIMAVNIFGQPADLSSLRKIADDNNLILIEDNAQAPAALFEGKYTGTLGHMGVFSLNRHKTMQTGEGGVVITDSKCLANRLRLVRNHGESVIPETEEFDGHEDIIGFNYRLTELQAAIAKPQLERIDELNKHRIYLADYLTQKLAGIEFLTPPAIRPSSSHVYYLYPMKFNSEKLGISRNIFAKAMAAEGMPVSNYVRPLTNLPLFKKKFGEDACYNLENFPIVKKLWEDSMLVTPICRPPLVKTDIDEFVSAILKVANNVKELSEE